MRELYQGELPAPLWTLEDLESFLKKINAFGFKIEAGRLHILFNTAYGEKSIHWSIFAREDPWLYDAFVKGLAKQHPNHDSWSIQAEHARIRTEARDIMRDQKDRIEKARRDYIRDLLRETIAAQMIDTDFHCKFEFAKTIRDSLDEIEVEWILKS